MSICAVIPAAGRATRLGTSGPKILARLSPKETIWSILYEKLSPLVDHIHLVLSPEAGISFPPLPAKVTSSVQPSPTGMGDAIFRGYDIWSHHDAILVVWGDQVFVSTDTLKRSIAALREPRHHMVLPLARMASPYVEYVFEGQRLARVLQSREGDTTASNGFSDVGTFLLGTQNLRAGWENYLAASPRGAATGEINFLPFLPFLSARGWTVTPLLVPDETEARGINTPEDLAFFQRLYKQRS